jgi:uncharacterized protein
MREPFLKYVKNNLADGFLLIASGLPGAGKTATIEQAQRIRGGVILKSDVIRREILKGRDIFDVKVAADKEQRARVYDVLLERAGAALNSEKKVYLDATFFTGDLRKRAAAVAAQHKTALVIFEPVCPEAICLARILGRDKATSVSNAVTEEAYRANQKTFEPVDINELKKTYPGLKIVHVKVDTSQKTSAEWEVTGEEIR